MGCGAGLGGSHRGSAHQDRSLQLVRYAWRTWGPRHAGIHPGSWSRHQRRGGGEVAGSIAEKGTPASRRPRAEHLQRTRSM